MSDMSDKPTKGTWLQLVRRWLRDGGHWKVDRWDQDSGEHTRHYINRYGQLVRETVEHLDPESFAREHISADVIDIRKQKSTTLPPIPEPPGAA
jgi:hypothetical protein